MLTLPQSALLNFIIRFVYQTYPLEHELARLGTTNTLNFFRANFAMSLF
jgi:hypothetical protein